MTLLAYLDFDKSFKKKNKGFSLVELIIVIAIMAILSAAIAPALIRYIVKARKADDIAAADSLGTTVNAAINSNDEAYDYISGCANWIKKENRSGYYRIVCFMNAGYQMTGWGTDNDSHFPNIGSGYDEGRSEIQKCLEELMGEYVFKMKFTTKETFDQWIICTDKDCNIYVFAGAGINNNIFYITPEHKVATGHEQRVYMLWPSVDPAYNALSKPPASFQDN